MTDLSDAAGAAPTAASTSSGRELSLPGWAGGLDSERAERDRLITQARSSDAARQLLRCFPRWTARARASELAGARAAGRQRAGRPQRPATGGATATPTPRRSFTATAREAQRHAPDFGGDRGPDRRPGARRPRRRPRLEHGHHPSERARRAAGRAHAALPVDLEDPAVWAYRSTSGARSPPARARGRSGGRPVAVGARPPRPVRRRRPALLADRLGHLAVARRRAARGGGQGRAAGRRCSSCRRSGRATAGS